MLNGFIITRGIRGEGERYRRWPYRGLFRFLGNIFLATCVQPANRYARRVAAFNNPVLGLVLLPWREKGLKAHRQQCFPL